MPSKSEKIRRRVRRKDTQYLASGFVREMPVAGRAGHGPPASKITIHDNKGRVVAHKHLAEKEKKQTQGSKMGAPREKNKVGTFKPFEGLLDLLADEEE